MSVFSLGKKHLPSVPGMFFIVICTFLLFKWITAGHNLALLVYMREFVFMGVHELGHYLFDFFIGNRFLTVFMWCGMELLVPILFYFSSVRAKSSIGAIISLFLLAIGLRSVGFYAGMIFEDNVQWIGVTQLPEYADGDWWYLHRWFGTVGREMQVRNFFYFLSALCATVGFWKLIQEFKPFSFFSKDRKVHKEIMQSSWFSS